VATLRLYFLGTLDIYYNGQQLPKPPTLKSQSLLAYLILHRHRPQPRDRLAELFWGARPERKARRSLSTALWHIRRCLPEEGLILSDADTAQFDPQRDPWVDVDEFESLVSRHDVASLRSALALYRGDFLDGFYDEWVLNERYRLESLVTAVLARLMTSQEARGDHESALAIGLRLLEQDRLREDAHRLTMRTYCRLGQRNAALEQYRRCREIVQEELGAEPMVETTELYQQILDGRFAAGRVPEAVPVEVLVEPPAPAIGRSPLDAVAVSKLVGREEELAFLDQCWQAAEAEEGGLVVISAEAGVGKTRLVEEFANRLRWQGIRTLWGRCYEFERALPYQPVAEALRSVLPAVTTDELAGFPAWTLGEVAHLVPEVLEKRVLSPEPSRRVEGPTGLEVTPETPSDQERARLLEDLHWASESTLQLLHYLARHLAGHQVLMVGTFRPEAIGLEHPLLDLRRRLTREGLAEPLRLSRLSRVAVEAMVVEMSGAGQAVVPLARRLHQETEGNPFFVMEIVKALFETGVLCLEAGVWQGDFAQISEGQLPLPATLSDAIQARVRRLNEESQEALRLAAVLGREFDFDLLNSVCARGEENVLEALDDLLRHRLIEEGTGAVGRDYAFTHHKIQEVIYSAMPRRHRQHIHARAGMAMESVYGTEVEELAGELAFHFQEGRQHDETLTEKAIAYLLQGGDRARTFYAHQEAVDHYQEALALLKEQREYERAARTLMKLGLTHHTAFEFRRASRAYEEGFSLRQRAAQVESAVQPPPAPHALRASWWDPPSLDPAMGNDVLSIPIIDQLFCGLLEHGPELEVVPDVARSWEVSEGGRKYVFHLRDDVRWSDGTPVTAADFEYAWKRVLNPATGSLAANLLYDVKGAQAFHQGDASDPDRVGVCALDEVTLVVELEQPTGYFPHLLAHNATYPVPRHLVEAHGEGWMEAGEIATNGPFRLETWQRGASIVLTCNPQYHGRFRGNLRRVELTLLGDPSARLELYEADGSDVLYTMFFPPETIDRMRQRHMGEYVPIPQLLTSYVGFCGSRPPFDDPRVRRALALATDREKLADVTIRGYVSPGTGGFAPPGMPGHSAGIGLPYDPEQARRLLAEAGYPSGRGFPTVDLLMHVDPLSPIASEYLRAQWRENLGVETRGEAVEWAMFLDRLEKEPPHMVLWGWVADYPDPDSFLRVGLSHIRGYTRWQNETYDRLLEEARRITDKERRMKLYAEADKILVEEAPILPLTYMRSHLLIKPWVRRLPLSAIKWWFWKDVIIESH